MSKSRLYKDSGAAVDVTDVLSLILKEVLDLNKAAVSLSSQRTENGPAG